MSPSNLKRISIFFGGLGCVSIVALAWYAIRNTSGHSGFDPYSALWLFIPLFLWGLLVFFLSFRLKFKKAVAMFSLLVASAGILLLVYLDKSNTLVYYETWVKRGLLPMGADTLPQNTSSENKAEYFLDQGILSAQQDKFGEAITYFQKAIELDQKNGDAYYNRGGAYLEIGDFEKAIIDYSRAIEIQPSYAKNYYNRGIAYFQTNNFQKAIADFLKVTEIQPDAAPPHSYVGHCHLKMECPEKSIPFFKKAVELEPQKPRCYNDLALAYAHALNFDLAVENYTKALELKPDFAEARYNRARVYYVLHKNDECRKDIDMLKELRYVPDHVPDKQEFREMMENLAVRQQ